MREELLRMENIIWESGGERYLDNLNFHVISGEIMGLIASGSKGLGQLIELIGHNVPIQFGRVYYLEKLVNQYSYSDGSDNRVYVIEENSGLIDSLSVADNIFVLRKGFRKYVVNSKVLNNQVLRMVEEMSISIPPDKKAADLNPFERCVVELLKAKMMGCRLIILKHPANFLGQMHLQEFHRIIQVCCENGVSFIYIGNHHQDIFKIAHRVSLFSDGRIKKVFVAGEMTDAAILPYIISYDLPDSGIRIPEDEIILRIKNFSAGQGVMADVEMRKGECLTLLDPENYVIGDLGKGLGGQLADWTGEVMLDGKSLRAGDQMFRMDGLAVIPDDPTETYLFPDMNAMENLTFLLDQKIGKSLIKKSYLKSIRSEYAALTGPCIDAAKIGELTVRERYSLVYYRVHLFKPKVAVCIQPLAKGDMYCRRHVLDLIFTLKKSGISVLLLTNNITDTLDVSDRLLVLTEGRPVTEYRKEDFDKVKR